VTPRHTLERHGVLVVDAMDELLDVLPT
jgi:hypothetical protein